MGRSRKGTPGLSLGELEGRLREGRVDPVYLVTGEEGYLRRRALDSLREAVVGADGDETTALERHDGERAAMGDILDSARSLSLFTAAGSGPTRLVLVLGFDPARVDDVDELERYLADPVPETCLVFQVEKLDKRYAASKLLAAQARVVRCDPPTGARRVRQWIRGKVEDEGRRIDDDAVDFLMETVALQAGGREDSFRLDPVARELEKAVLYVEQGATIGVRDLERLLGHSREHSVFELTDHLVRGDAERAVGTLNRLLDEGQQPFGVLGLIAWMLRQLVIAADVSDKGMPRMQAMREVGGPWDGRAAILEVGAACDRERLEELLASCSDADLKVKMMGAGAGSRGVLEDLCRRICRAGD